MSRDKDFKRLVRRRMGLTGERYTHARERLRAGGPAIEWRLVGERKEAYELVADGDAQVVRCVGEPGGRPGGASGSVPAAPYRGQRVRFSARLRAEDAPGWSAIWMRVDGADGKPLAFASTWRDPVRGTTGWEPRAVVLDVPPEAESLAFGSSLSGRGVLRLAGVRLEAVPDSVPVSAFAGLGVWTLDGPLPERYELRQQDGVHVLRSVGAAGEGVFGSMSRAIAADEHRGRRVRLSASLRGDVTSGWAGLWMRVDDAERRMLRFDNMEPRGLRGRFDWTEAAVVLDIPPEATIIAHGVLLTGEGVVRVADVRLEEVDSAVATTGVHFAGDGWFLSSQELDAYEFRTELSGGRRIGVLRSVTEVGADSGAVAQLTAGEPFRGRRVTFRAELRGDAVDGEVVVGFAATRFWVQEQVEAVSPPPLRGTFGWTPVEASVDVPQDGSSIVAGVMLTGTGTVRIANASLDGAELGFDG